ncbi:MAG TPA: hypothetical protein VF618_04045 [Thermoanaerobaculia bacterium]
MRLLVPALLWFFALPLFAGDLTVGWISRLPEKDYVWASASPKTDGWPAVGEQVSWRAHVRNYGAAVPNVRYRWLLDGQEVGGGTVNVAANSITTVDYPWSWTFDRHRLAFQLDGASSLEVFTDALSVAFYIEQSVYDLMREKQPLLGVGATGFEDYAQRHIELFNDMAALAVYTETPNGVLDRIRLQKIVVVPDGALPLVPLEDLGVRDGEPNAEMIPNKADRSVDLMWGFPKSIIGKYVRTDQRSPRNPLYIDGYVLHEMGHARYLNDVYAWNVRHVSPHYSVDILENGVSIFSRYILNSSRPHETPEQGLMNEHFTFFDRYSAITMNKIAGHRATRGNYNEPENIGSFLNDLPAENRLTIRDRDGVALANADVWIFRGEGKSDAWYAAVFDNIPDLKLRTDEHGQVLVGRSPFSADGRIVQYWKNNNSTAIVRVAAGERVLYGFLESRLFNLAYWRGDTAFADHDLNVGMPYCGNLGVSLTAPAWDERDVNPSVTLRWTRLERATLYRVYASTTGGPARLIGTTGSTSLTTQLHGKVYWWVEADGNDCAMRRSAVGRFYAPNAAGGPRRRAVGR